QDALFLGAVAGSRIEDLDLVVGLRDRRLQALAGLGQNLLGAGDLLANLHAADADGEVQRVLVDVQHAGLETGADLLGDLVGAGVIAAAQHGKSVVGEPRADHFVGNQPLQSFASRAQQVVDMTESDTVDQTGVTIDVN